MHACDHACDIGHFCKSISLVVYERMIAYAMLALLDCLKTLINPKRILTKPKKK